MALPIIMKSGSCRNSEEANKRMHSISVNLLKVTAQRIGTNQKFQVELHTLANRGGSEGF